MWLRPEMRGSRGPAPLRWRGRRSERRLRRACRAERVRRRRRRDTRGKREAGPRSVHLPACRVLLLHACCRHVGGPRSSRWGAVALSRMPSSLSVSGIGRARAGREPRSPRLAHLSSVRLFGRRPVATNARRGTDICVLEKSERVGAGADCRGLSNRAQIRAPELMPATSRELRRLQPLPGDSTHGDPCRGHSGLVKAVERAAVPCHRFSQGSRVISSISWQRSISRTGGGTGRRLRRARISISCLPPRLARIACSASPTRRFRRRRTKVYSMRKSL